MPPTLVVIIVGALLAYILYLRLQLHLHDRLLHKIEQIAVVVPAQGEGQPNYGLALALAVMFFALLFLVLR